MLASSEEVGIHDCQICGKMGDRGVFWGSAGDEEDMKGIYICSSCVTDGKLGVLLADGCFDWLKVAMKGRSTIENQNIMEAFLEKNISNFWRVFALHLLKVVSKKIEVV